MQVILLQEAFITTTGRLLLSTPRFWAARLRTLPPWEFCACVSVHGLCAPPNLLCICSKPPLTCFSHWCRGQALSTALSHVFRLPHSHSSFPLHPEVPVSAPHLANHCRTLLLLCADPEKEGLAQGAPWEHKVCSWGSRSALAASPRPCRDRACFSHDNATLKNHFSS